MVLVSITVKNSESDHYVLREKWIIIMTVQGVLQSMATHQAAD